MSDTEYIKKEMQMPLVTQYYQRVESPDDVNYMQSHGGNDWLINGLKTDVDKGIDSNTIETRKSLYGSGKIESFVSKSFQKCLCQTCNDLYTGMLVFGGIAVLLINFMSQKELRSIQWSQSSMIFVVVTTMAMFKAKKRYDGERSLSSLDDLSQSNKKATVIRDGEDVVVELAEIVPGDICHIVTGMEIPGDGILLEGFGVTTSEELLDFTEERHKANVVSCNRIHEQGHPYDTFQKAPSPILISGTKITGGCGKALIFMNGPDSVLGQTIKAYEYVEASLSTLDKKTQKIANTVSKIGMIAAASILMLFAFKFNIIHLIKGVSTQETPFQTTWHEYWANGILLAISILITTIPKIFAISQSIILLYTNNLMLRGKNLVRSKNDMENIGNVNIVLSDKTGIITRNQLYLTNYWNFTNQALFDLRTGKSSSYSEWVHPSFLEIFEGSIAINNLSDIERGEGSPIDLALAKYLNDCGINSRMYRQKYEFMHIETFTSERNRMSSIIKLHDGKYRLFTTGNIDYIAPACDKILRLGEGKIESINEKIKDEISSAIVNYSEKNLKIMGMAYVDLPDKYDTEYGANFCLKIELSGLTLIGISGMHDFYRSDVPETILEMNQVGVQVIILTSGNKISARAMAKKVDLIKESNNDPYSVLEGPELSRITGGIVCKNCKENPEKSEENCDCVNYADEQNNPINQGKKVFVPTLCNLDEFSKISKKIAVLARCRPEDKFALVLALKELGNVVAVTGSKSSDVDAQKIADVGFSLGITGSETLKEASGIMLMDDNFSSILNGVKFGRHLYDTISKFLVYQMTLITVALIGNLISAVFTKQALLTATQMLWIIFGISIIVSFILTNDMPDKGILSRKPYPRNYSFISVRMGKHILGQVVYQLSVMMCVFFYGENFLIAELDKTQKGSDLVICGLEDTCNYDLAKSGPSIHMTYCFNIFVIMQIFNMFNARKVHDQLNVFQGIQIKGMNTVYLLIMLVLQWLLVTFGGSLFRCTSWGLGPFGWLICVAFGVGSLLVSFLQRQVPLGRSCNKKETSENDGKAHLKSD